jgi:hypothetical protein
MLPMSPSAGREYAVTLSEQHFLASKYGISNEALRVCLFNLKKLMISGVISPQKTANKTKAVIASHIESSNAAERQGA